MAASTSSSLLFNDTFAVKEVDRDGKKFDRGTAPPPCSLNPSNAGTVSRITAHSSNHEMDLTLDVRSSLLPSLKS